MKKALSLLFLLAVLFSADTVNAASPDIRGVWVSTVYNLDYPSSQGLSKAQLEAEADDIINNVSNLGLNALFFQVRPCADSFFPSDIFPWSAYLSGTQGAAPDGGFDPLGYFVKKCHENGIELHCWINPYRITKTKAASKEEALALLSKTHPARLHPEYVVFHSDGCLYFDPGNPEAQALILSGIKEIIDNYDIDGIHFDDYFYPEAEFEDADTYASYGKEYTTIEDFRRASVTAFVSKVNDLVAASNKDISFGISPFGIWANSSDNPEGSNTVGNQSYYSHYADSLSWVKQGIVDYIAPQLYWNIGNKEGEFKTLLDWWSSAVKDKDVKLYIGQAAYRMNEAEVSSPWFGTSEIKQQLSLMDDSGVEGTIFFRYGSIKNHRPLYWFIKSAFNPSVTQKDTNSLYIARGTQEYTSGQWVYFAGSSNSALPLYINGTELESRSGNGYFGCNFPLVMGENIFWFTNGSEERKITIYRVASSANTNLTLSKAEPLSDTYFAGNTNLAVGCSAPKASKVYAFVSSTASRLYDDGSGCYSSVDVPSDNGHILYTCEKNGMVMALISSGKYLESMPLSAIVASDMCDIYYSPDKTAGASGFLQKGMAFNIESYENGFAYNSALGYIYCDDLTIDFENTVAPIAITNISTGKSSVDFYPGSPCSVSANYHDGTLYMTFPNISKAFLFESALFSSVTSTKDGSSITYALTPSQEISGYEITYTEAKVTLTLYHKRSFSEGITVLIDPGHGGDALGAPGLKQDVYEKEINLTAALILKEQLEALGINAILTRDSDKDLSLKERLTSAITQKPDLFISLHSNSAAEGTDGLQLYNNEIFSKSSLSGAVMTNIKLQLSQIGEECLLNNDSRLYLCRAESTNAILLENQYIINPYCFEKLTDRDFMTSYYSAVAQGIYNYFK
ncbi:MAG: family 10 glycosylhydrolase [Clostridiaceae bacterium]|nr:family 10 glycosylhydrolase [Clostridiaceae bacterium]